MLNRAELNAVKVALARLANMTEDEIHAETNTDLYLAWRNAGRFFSGLDNSIFF